MRFIIMLIVLLTSMQARSIDYDVDMPNSGDKNYEMVRITVDGCISKFLIKKEEFSKFTNNPTEMANMVKKAIEKAASGCTK